MSRKDIGFFVRWSAFVACAVAYLSIEIVYSGRLVDLPVAEANALIAPFAGIAMPVFVSILLAGMMLVRRVKAAGVL